MDIISRDNICQYNINYINFFLLLKKININILLINQNHTYSYNYKLLYKFLSLVQFIVFY